MHQKAIKYYVIAIFLFLIQMNPDCFASKAGTQTAIDLIGISAKGMRSNNANNKKHSLGKHQDIKVTFKKHDTQKCTFVKKISSKIIIELWEKSKGCEKIINDLKQKAFLLGGDLLFIKFTSTICNAKNIVGLTYKCKTKIKK